MTQAPGFYIAPFAVDGQGEGIVYQEQARLSAQWLYVCRNFIERNTAGVEAVWEGELAHISTKLTAAPGVALASFKVNGETAASLLLASGALPAAEDQVIEMFIRSMAQVELVRENAAPEQEPFEALREILDRPLMVVVPWPSETIAQQDRDLVQELAVHLAGAFFGNPPRARE